MFGALGGGLLVRSLPLRWLLGLGALLRRGRRRGRVLLLLLLRRRSRVRFTRTRSLLRPAGGGRRLGRRALHRGPARVRGLLGLLLLVRVRSLSLAVAVDLRLARRGAAFERLAARLLAA